MPEILLTGANGFLGKEVVRLLNEHDYNFAGVGRNISTSSKLSCDLSILEDVIKLLEKTSPKIIINLAASADFLEKNPSSLFSINTLLPAIFAEYCIKNNSHLIQASGIIVHGFSHVHFSKKTELKPDNAYGKTKLLADQIITMSGCQASILRLGGIFGDNGPLHLGINKAIIEAKKGTPPRIINTGSAKRNYIFVKDVALAIIDTLEKGLTGIHYLGGETKTIKSMLNDICDIFLPGNQPEHIEGPESQDQLIESDNNFKITPFRLALEEMV
tara:strand:+ start:19152 stop:19970 length:819 start_codon:yes stop_codon:yes gene_type:complete